MMIAFLESAASITKEVTASSTWENTDLIKQTLIRLLTVDVFVWCIFFCSTQISMALLAWNLSIQMPSTWPAPMWRRCELSIPSWSKNHWRIHCRACRVCFISQCPMWASVPRRRWSDPAAVSTEWTTGNGYRPSLLDSSVAKNRKKIFDFNMCWMRIELENNSPTPAPGGYRSTLKDWAKISPNLAGKNVSMNLYCRIVQSVSCLEICSTTLSSMEWNSIIVPSWPQSIHKRSRLPSHSSRSWPSAGLDLATNVGSCATLSMQSPVSLIFVHFTSTNPDWR